MPVIKVKLCDSAGAPLAGQPVKISGCEELMSNAQGMTQFLLAGDGNVDVLIKGVAAWSGPIADLPKEVTFKQSGAGFAKA